MHLQVNQKRDVLESATAFAFAPVATALLAACSSKNWTNCIHCKRANAGKEQPATIAQAVLSWIMSCKARRTPSESHRSAYSTIQTCLELLPVLKPWSRRACLIDTLASRYLGKRILPAVARLLPCPCKTCHNHNCLLSTWTLIMMSLQCICYVWSDLYVTGPDKYVESCIVR